MAGKGRPSKYNDETIPLTLEYIENYKTEGDAMPSIAGLACVLGVARDTIHAWRHDEGKEDFSDILDKLLATQERVLFNRSLLGDYNASIAKLALGKHGYSDKVESDNRTTIDLSSYTLEQLENMANE